MFKETLEPYFSKKDSAMGLVLGLPIYFYVAPSLSLAFIKLFLSLSGKTMYVSQANSVHNLLVDAISAISFIILLFGFMKASWKYFMEHASSILLWCFTVGLGINYLASFISSMITSLFISGDSANQQAIESIMGVSPVPMILAVVIFAPIVEELIFRGVIFRTVRRKNVYLAHFISAFVFGFLHCYQGIFAGDWTQILFLFSYMCPGFVFSYVYEKQKTIIAPIIVHMLNNFISILIIMSGV